MTAACQGHGSRCLVWALVAWALVAWALVAWALAAWPAPSLAAPPAVPAWVQGIHAAHACEGQIDADLWAYAACIDHAAAQRGQSRAARAALHFQAWLMADGAWQQNSEGAALLRERWWRAWLSDSRRGRLTLDEVCRVRGLSCADIRARACLGKCPHRPAALQ